MKVLKKENPIKDSNDINDLIKELLSQVLGEWSGG